MRLFTFFKTFSPELGHFICGLALIGKNSSEASKTCEQRSQKVAWIRMARGRESSRGYRSFPVINSPVPDDNVRSRGACQRKKKSAEQLQTGFYLFILFIFYHPHKSNAALTEKWNNSREKRNPRGQIRHVIRHRINPLRRIRGRRCD